MVPEEDQDELISYHAYSLLLNFAFINMKLSSVYLTYPVDNQSIGNLLGLFPFKRKSEKEGMVTYEMDALFFKKSNAVNLGL